MSRALGVARNEVRLFRASAGLLHSGHDRSLAVLATLVVVTGRQPERVAS